MNETYGWWFADANGCVPRTGEKVTVGLRVTVEPPIILCRRGLHGSLRLRDALVYSYSSILARCAYEGEIVHGDDKFAASQRTVLWVGDIELLLHEAACHFAERALAAIKSHDPRSVAAIAAKRAWLRGEITDSALSAAEDAAWDAAWSAAASAARDDAWDAARDAAWRAAASAARDDAWDAARDAAWRAAESAARSAAWDAAESAACAAWSAAASAARDAAWSEQNDWLECAAREFAGVD